MKKLLATALLSLVVLGLGEHRASAFGCCKPCCGTCIPCCNAQYNAFSPMCQGVMVKKCFGFRKCCYPTSLCPPACPICPVDPCAGPGAPPAPGALPPAGHAGMIGLPYSMPQGLARVNGYPPSYNYGYPQAPVAPAYGTAMNNGPSPLYWNTSFQGAGR